ncbi:MAG TPA: bile acid:sodium symporter family protein [Aliiroseovarius sp.]|nr:bile acid:sodium symporter family protein [Aliiroseovarius sp.]
MLSLGLGLTMPQIVDPLRDMRRVVLALLANFVLVPFLTWLILKGIPLDTGTKIGLVLLATAAGAPFLPKLAQIAKGDVAFSVGLMLLLMVASIIYLPLVLPLMLEGVEVDAAGIARSLALMMLLPLIVGLVVRAHAEDLAKAVSPFLLKLSNLALVLLTALLVLLNLRNILSMIGLDGLAIIAFLLASIGAGMALGGRSAPVRNVMGLGTGQRNISAALVVAGQNFDDPKVLVTLVVTAIVGLLILMPLASWLGRR